MEKLLRSAGLVETVKSAIFDAILTGQLGPGEKLQQEKLANSLGVSRQPVSHALRLLSESGILVPYDAKSLTVAELDHRGVAQIIDLRCEMECYGARLAAGRAAEGSFSRAEREDLDGLQCLVDRHVEAVATGHEDATQSLKDDLKFHSGIRRLSGNPYIDDMMRPYLLHYQRLMYQVGLTDVDRVWSEHALILDDIKHGRVEPAGARVREHIAAGAQRLSDYWDLREKRHL